MALADVPATTPSVYQALHDLPDGVVWELPAFRPDASESFVSQYQFWTTAHWTPLINGYSGNAPPAYLETQRILQTFPDDASIERLYDLRTRYIVVHGELHPPSERNQLLAQLQSRSELVRDGIYRDWIGTAQLFELRQRSR